MTDEAARAAFLDYWGRVRQRTEAVVARVPDDRFDWSPGAGALTMGELVRHIAVTERWLFVEVACGRPSRYDSHDDRWGRSIDDARAVMSTLHRESRALVSAFTDAEWNARVVTPAGASMAAWKWLRAMCEHEIHHRGQLYLMLRLCGITTPPIFGLTSEDVRSRSVSDRARSESS